MAYHPMWRPDSANPDQPDAVPPENRDGSGPPSAGCARIENSAASQESDFAELTAKLRHMGAARFPAELSGELALEIVLK